MAFCNRVVKSGVNSAIFFAKSRAIDPSSSSSFCNRFDYGHISQLFKPNNNKRAALVKFYPIGMDVVETRIVHTYYPSYLQKKHLSFDVRRLEAQGVPSKQAEAIHVRRLEAQGVTSKQGEAITAGITEVSNDSVENSEMIQYSHLSKFMIQDSHPSKFKSEVQSSEILSGEFSALQQHHFSLFQRETEKLRGCIEKDTEKLRGCIEKETEKLQGQIDKMRSELRYEIGKVGITFSSETTKLTNKIDREFHELRAQLEAAKYDVIKYFIGTLFSICAVGIATVRILL